MNPWISAMVNSVQTSVISLQAMDALRRANRGAASAMDKLSSGSRINSAMDDAAGLQISNKLQSQIMGVYKAIKNVMDFDGLLATADGALENAASMLQRIRELAVQASTGTLTAQDRSGLNQEAQRLMAAINGISSQTNWSGQKLLDGTFQDKIVMAGADTNSTLSISIPSSTVPSLFNYQTTFYNGDFSDIATSTNGSTITLNGWEINLQQVKLGQGTAPGTTMIGGYPAPIDSSPAPTNSANQTSLGDDTAPASATYNYSLSGNLAQLTSNMTTANGGDVVHGPYLISKDPVQISAGASISFDWRAQGGADAYDVYAYLLNVDDGSSVELLNQTGSGTGDTGWQTATQTITSDGNYKFVFVSGTFDESFGRAAGGSLYVDNVTVNGSKANSVDPEVILKLDTQENAKSAINKVDDAIANLNNTRTYIGVNRNRLSHIALSANVYSTELQQAFSRIKDTEYGSETSDLAKFQVLNQSANAILAQAKVASDDIMSFIKGVSLISFRG
jgi:flagellin